jgi:molybdopterin biosynthesis enzyme
MIEYSPMLTGPKWQEAQEKLLSWARPLSAESVPLRHALFSCAETAVSAALPYPPHNLALAQGFAVSFKELQRQAAQGGPPRFRFGGTLGGGRTYERKVQDNSALLVEPGMLLPDGLDAVVAPSATERVGNEVEIREVPDKPSGVWLRGVFAGQNTELVPRGACLGAASFAALHSQSLEEARIVRQPLVGSLIIGNGLADAAAAKPPDGACIELLSPMLRAACVRGQCSFVSQGVQEQHLTIPGALADAQDQVEALVVSGLLSDAQFEELRRTLEQDWELRIAGLAHPLGKQVLIAERNGRWLLFIPYHPPLLLALAALLLQPLVTRLKGHNGDAFSYAECAESASGDTADDIWLGREVVQSDRFKPARVKLLKQVSAASLADMARATCVAVPSTGGGAVEPNTPLAIAQV